MIAALHDREEIVTLDGGSVPIRTSEAALDGAGVLGSGQRVIAAHGRSIEFLVVVIEWLSFDVTEDERLEWLAVEEDVWSRFLERQPGFLRKEMWVERGEPSVVHAVIWWNSDDEWKRVTPEEVDRVDAGMGRHFRACRMRVFDVVRDC